MTFTGPARRSASASGPTRRLNETAGFHVGFGDADRKTLYIAARTGIHRIRVNVPDIWADAPSRHTA
jgi:hypothetical protein